MIFLLLHRLIKVYICSRAGYINTNANLQENIEPSLSQNINNENNNGNNNGNNIEPYQ